LSENQRSGDIYIRTVYMFVFFFPMPQLLVLIARLSALGERDRKDVIAINKRFGNTFYARVHLDDGDILAAQGLQFSLVALFCPSLWASSRARDDWSAIKEPYFRHLIKPSSPNYEQRVAGSAMMLKLST
jgi:hypothetical protein